MSTLSKEERQALCDMFERLLRDRASLDTLRSVVKQPKKFDASVWKELSELGLLSLMVAEESDGIGGDVQDLQAIMEISGRVLFPSPFLSTAVFAVDLLQACKNDKLKQECLSDISAGETIFAVTKGSATGSWSDETMLTATDTGDTWSVNGVASYVIDAPRADELLVCANTSSGIGVFCVSASDANIDPLETDDPSISLGSVTFQGASAEMLDGLDEAMITSALQTTLVGIAAHQAGAAQAIFEQTIEYLNTRYQFGRPIGSYQALKHMAADLLIEVESAITVSREAAVALANGKPDAAQLVWLAAFACADSFREVSAAAIQLHGGIAYTMEHDAHLFWRHARANQWLFGTSDQFREQYLQTWEDAA